MTSSDKHGQVTDKCSSLQKERIVIPEVTHNILYELNTIHRYINENTANHWSV